MSPELREDAREAIARRVRAFREKTSPVAIVPGEHRRAAFDVPIVEIVSAPAPKTCDCLYEEAEECCRHKQAARGPGFVIDGAICGCPCHAAPKWATGGAA